MPPTGIEHIATPAVEFYKQIDVAAALANKGRFDAAIPEWIKALAMSPNDARAHSGFGQTLARVGRAGAALAEYRKAIDENPNYPEVRNNLGIAVEAAGDPKGARQ